MPANPPLTPAQVQQFEQDGYLIVPKLFNAEEMDVLLKIAKADVALASEANGRKDAQGGVSKLALRNDLGDTVYAAIVRAHRVVDPMEQLLGGEVYHFHHKMMVKEPYVGGAWEWHQDYGYWYKFNFCLFPFMASCMVAVDRAHKGNGCLQVLKGSHLMGRIEHGSAGEQTGANMERVTEAMKRMELVYVELEPGSACFFHCNLLHRSDQNRSPDPRWSLICCYNAARNNPYRETGGHPTYNHLERWDDSKVLEVGKRQLERIEKERAQLA
ncbi:MAG: phytanoyl-CoA dioxygenase family protein [Planctomycetota bacterium]|nr:phytanoyl-CoA dioxygenase family protein [Planctomycetota bacterium]